MSPKFPRVPQGGAGAEVGVGMLKGGGIPFIEIKSSKLRISKVSKFQIVKVPKFQSSNFLSFNVSRCQIFRNSACFLTDLDPILPKFQFMFSGRN